MNLVELNRDIGSPEVFSKAFSTAWDECIELQCNPKAEWMGIAISSLQEHPRVFIGVLGDTELLGGLYLLREENDPHVGACMSIAFQYVLPEYRNLGVSRRLITRALQLTRKNNCSVLAYTHRKGDWKYETVYRRVS